MRKINGEPFEEQPSSCGMCPFFSDGMSDLGAPSKGHCRLFDEITGGLVLPRRCKKLFASAFNFPDGIELVVVGKLKNNDND